MSAPSEATFLEVYGRGSIVRAANTSRRDVNVKGVGALDLRTTRDDGSFWDFRKREHRRDAMRLIDTITAHLQQQGIS